MLNRDNNIFKEFILTISSLYPKNISNTMPKSSVYQLVLSTKLFKKHQWIRQTLKFLGGVRLK